MHPEPNPELSHPCLSGHSGIEVQREDRHWSSYSEPIMLLHLAADPLHILTSKNQTVVSIRVMRKNRKMEGREAY